MKYLSFIVTLLIPVLILFSIHPSIEAKNIPGPKPTKYPCDKNNPKNCLLTLTATPTYTLTPTSTSTDTPTNTPTPTVYPSGTVSISASSSQYVVGEGFQYFLNVSLGIGSVLTNVLPEGTTGWVTHLVTSNNMTCGAQNSGKWIGCYCALAPACSGRVDVVVDDHGTIPPEPFTDTAYISTGVFDQNTPNKTSLTLPVVTPTPTIF